MGPQRAPGKRAGLTARLVLLAAGLLAVAPPRAAGETSEPARLAARSLLLGLARAGDRLIAVGDRGDVLVSDDGGVAWRQVIVPARAMLTAVSCPDAQHGWAVGHDGVILATADRGQSWVRQDSGQDLDTVWLDVFFSDAQHGLAVGAYGKCQFTLDGGRTWRASPPPADEAHLNKICPTATDLVYLAGEAGTLVASADARKAWRKLEVPYDGSLFGLLALDERRLIAYGLRGHVFVSDDAGATWAPHPVAQPVLLMAGLRMSSGEVILAGQGGNCFLSRDRGATFTSWQPAGAPGSIAALVEAAPGVVVAAGEYGVARLPLPAAP